VKPPPVWDGHGEDPWLPARLAAALDAATAERKIFRVVWDRLASWVTSTAGRVTRGAGMPDPVEVWSEVPAWQRNITAIIQEGIKPVMGWAYAKLLGDGYAWEGRPAVETYLAGVRNRMSNTPNEVFNLITGQIAAAVGLGEAIPEISARVDKVLSATRTPRWENRAVVIARTECLTGDALVQSDGIKAVYRRRYEGDAFRIYMSSGEQFTATANHPILTACGWVGAGGLMPGDDLLCHPGGQGLRASGNVDIGRMPASIAELYDALSTVGVVIRSQTGKPDFHGDGMNGYVDVATTDWELLDGLQGAQHRCDLGLEFANPSLASLHGASQLLTIGGHPGWAHDSQWAQPSLYGVDADSEFFRKVGSARSFGVLSSEGLHVQVKPPRPLLSEKVKLSSLCGAQAANRLPAVGEYGSDPLVTDAELLSNSLDPIARPVGVDKILRVERIRFSGHVYNLTTRRGWFGVGSHYSGNTLGALNASRNDANMAFAARSNEELVKIWLATADLRTREAHRLADGQRRAPNMPFDVGGEALMFPGDPSGSAGNVISCRCTTLLVPVGEALDLSNRQSKGR